MSGQIRTSTLGNLTRQADQDGFFSPTTLNPGAGPEKETREAFEVLPGQEDGLLTFPLGCLADIETRKGDWNGICVNEDGVL